MPLRMITGEFRVLGTQPDGDSVRFYPDDPDAWSRTGVRARVNPSGGVQLRLDAIDAVETHYTPPKGTGRLHQPVGLGRAATGCGRIGRADWARVLVAEGAIVAGAAAEVGVDPPSAYRNVHTWRGPTCGT